MADSHDVDWTEEKVAAFWEEPRRGASYFSATVGPALASWIHRNARPTGLVVDVGCGHGHLLVEVQALGHEVFGIDASNDSLRHAAERIGSERVALGTLSRLPLEDGSAGTLLLVETIEHVLDKDLDPMMSEVRRVLAPGAPLVITTPNNEDLDASKVVCPDCHARFHPVQHVRSWSSTTLRAFLREHGFDQTQTFETHLPHGRGLMALQRRLRFQLRGSRPNLIAIARRPRDGQSRGA